MSSHVPLPMSHPHGFSLRPILFQPVFQGLVSGLLSVYAFSQALRLAGPSAGPYTAMTPGIAALLAVPVLGQIPDLLEVFSLVSVVTGLAILATAQNRADAAPPTQGDT